MLQTHLGLLLYLSFLFLVDLSYHEVNRSYNYIIIISFQLPDLNFDGKKCPFLMKLSFCDLESMQKWLLWGYWFSPLTYGMNALAVNEFLGKSWRHVSISIIIIIIMSMAEI